MLTNITKEIHSTKINYISIKVASVNNSLLLDKLRQAGAALWKTDVVGWTCLHHAVEVCVVCCIKNESYTGRAVLRTHTCTLHL